MSEIVAYSPLPIFRTDAKPLSTSGVSETRASATSAKGCLLSVIAFLLEQAQSHRNSNRPPNRPWSKAHRSAEGHSDARTLPAIHSISGVRANSECKPCQTPRPTRVSTQNTRSLQRLQGSRSGEWIPAHHRFRPLREAEPGSCREVRALSAFRESLPRGFRCLPRYHRRKRPRRSQDALRSFR